MNGDVTDVPLQIDQSALTGESLPVDKKKGAIAYSSSVIKQGQMLGVVTKTGVDTYIGRAANLISNTHDVGHFQKIVGNIGNFLIIISVVCFFLVDTIITSSPCALFSSFTNNTICVSTTP